MKYLSLLMLPLLFAACKDEHHHHDKVEPFEIEISTGNQVLVDAITGEDHSVLALVLDQTGIVPTTNLIKFDRNGNVDWTLGLNSMGEPGRISCAPNGNFLVAGQAFDTLTGIRLEGISRLAANSWSKTVNLGFLNPRVNALVYKNDHFYACGSHEIGPSYAAWLAAFDIEGNLEWTRNIGIGLTADDIAFNANGQLMVLGTSFAGTLGDRDMAVWQFSTTADSLATNYYGTTAYEESRRIIPSGDGNFLLAGHSTFDDPSHSNILVKISPTGQQLWSHFSGQPNVHDGAEDVAVDEDGIIWLSGYADRVANLQGCGFLEEDRTVTLVNQDGTTNTATRIVNTIANCRVVGGPILIDHDYHWHLGTAYPETGNSKIWLKLE
jgi:hypothetical protein